MAKNRPKKENEKLVKLVEQDNDLSYADIGKEFGITKQAVHQRYENHSEDVDN